MKEQHFSTASSRVARRTDAAGIYIDTQIVEQRQRMERCRTDDVDMTERSRRGQKSDHHCQPSHNIVERDERKETI